MKGYPELLWDIIGLYEIREFHHLHKDESDDCHTDHSALESSRRTGGQSDWPTAKTVVCECLQIVCSLGLEVWGTTFPDTLVGGAATKASVFWTALRHETCRAATFRLHPGSEHWGNNWHLTELDLRAP